MPLIVVGPRQVGKTYIINKYCQEKYNNYCYINLFEDKRLIKISAKNFGYNQENKIKTIPLYATFYLHKGINRK